MTRALPAPPAKGIGQLLRTHNFRRDPFAESRKLLWNVVHEVPFDSETRISQHGARCQDNPTIGTDATSRSRVTESLIAQSRRLRLGPVAPLEATLELQDLSASDLVELPARVWPPAKYIELDEHQLPRFN